MLRKAAYLVWRFSAGFVKVFTHVVFMKKSIRYSRINYLFLLSILIISCGPAVSLEDLYGEWKYIQVESPKNPEESLSAQEVEQENPSITFSKDGDLIIMWGGKKLSNGKFHIEGKLIRYKENLPGGKTREFPFLIKKLTGEELIFETMEQQPTRITARKIRS